MNFCKAATKMNCMKTTKISIRAHIFQQDTLVVALAVF